jgi:oligopeptide/dipeptide ABC transporter ATP-binding protein
MHSIIHSIKERRIFVKTGVMDSSAWKISRYSEKLEAPLLRIKGLNVYFAAQNGVSHVVRDITLELAEGETLGLVGESGSGKSVLSLAIMGLIPNPPGEIRSGRMEFDGRDLLALSEADMCAVRGNEIAMVFQEPMTSLNPIHTCGKQIIEALVVHKECSKREAHARALALLEQVEIPEAARRMREYPHQLSGGMRQRVMIAMALACRPRLLIADEPTTALDVTVQAQILELLRALHREEGSAILLITHDLGVVAEMCQRAAVMYAGQIVEVSPVAALFEHPHHPYSEGLILSIPVISSDRRRLVSIEGTVPNPFDMFEGCAFAPRCPYAGELCRRQCPTLSAVAAGRQVRCWNWRQTGSGFHAKEGSP